MYCGYAGLDLGLQLVTNKLLMCTVAIIQTDHVQEFVEMQCPLELIIIRPPSTHTPGETERVVI